MKSKCLKVPNEPQTNNRHSCIFSSFINPLFKNLEQVGTPYVPLWCMGYAMGSFNANTFSKNFSTSLNSYVTAAASMPSSRTSGSGGRVSSGGSGGW
jgi:hypothetical protein